MFSNIIIFISALIISVLYPESSSENISTSTSVAALFASYIVFYLIVEKGFKRLENSNRADISILLNKYSNLFSIIAIIIFSLNVYIFELTDIFKDIWIFKSIPTFIPLILMVIFTVFMWLVWSASYNCFRISAGMDISKKELIETQTGFALPSILPWFVISVLFDLLNLLPWDGFKTFLESIYGQLIFVILLMLLISGFLPLLLKRFWRCSMLKDADTQGILENLSRRTGVKYREALDWPLFGGKMITAGVVGLFRKFRYILVTQGFLNYLSYQEKEAVIAHEFGHVKHGHLLWYLFIFLGFILASNSIAQNLIYPVLILLPMETINLLESFEKFSSVLVVSLVVLSFVLFFRFIFGYFMRNFERQADAYSFNVSGSSYALISTFKKIAAMTAEPPDKPNWHHYSIKERVDFLIQCQENPGIIEKHNKKLRKSLAVYFIIIATILMAGFSLNNTFESKIFLDAQQKRIEYMLDKGMENHDIYFTLGNILISKNDDINAVYAFQKAISFNENSIDAMNNLAWLFLTSQNKEIRNPERGLKIAEKAFSIAENPPPHLIDTLAEAYYLSGEMERACSLAQKAYNKAIENRSHYKKQLDKICSLK